MCTVLLPPGVNQILVIKYIKYENSQVINRLIVDIHQEIDTKNGTSWCVLW